MASSHKCSSANGDSALGDAAQQVGVAITPRHRDYARDPMIAAKRLTEHPASNATLGLLFNFGVLRRTFTLPSLTAAEYGEDRGQFDNGLVDDVRR